MSPVLLVLLTVVEIVALVAVLALFVIVITRRLRSLANTIRQVGEGVIGPIQGDVFLVGAGAAILNRKLNAIAKALPAIAEKAESLAAARQSGAQVPKQTNPQASGTGWRPAIGQDPAIRRG
ncbi:MAG: hypothetical protein M3Y48_10655 [Actinomycetota bacterium]|nr:hypothetical protein [Actinomycetota bacterium]